MSDAFDTTPTLSPDERAAMADHLRRPLRGRARLRLARLVAPLEAVHALADVDVCYLQGARRVLYAEMLRRGTSFWAWDSADWLETCGHSAEAFAARYRRAQHGRPHLLALAYLLGGVPDLRPFGIGPCCVPLANIIFGVARVDAALARVAGALYGPEGLGYLRGRQCASLRWALCLAFLLNRSPDLAALSIPFLHRLTTESTIRMASFVGQLGRAMLTLGLVTRPGAADVDAAWQSDAAGVPAAWAAWSRAWYAHAVHQSLQERKRTLEGLYAVGRWLGEAQPGIERPEQWDEDLALAYVQHLCSTARIGQDASARGQQLLARKHVLGQPFAPGGIANRLAYLRRAFSDWQDRPHAVDGAPARAIPIRFKPQQAFAIPRHIKARMQPDPRDIDLGIWYKLAYVAATLRDADLARHGRHSYYPLALYRALALLWVSAARRPNELRRLRTGCVRREWEPTMRDEHGQVLEQGPEAMCYLHVPSGKTRGAFWIWIPTYTADAIAAWERERPAQQSARLDPKDRQLVESLFLIRNRQLGDQFLNEHLLPLLCALAGVPERDAHGQITAHRGRSTRATLLRKLGVPLADIAAYLGHADEKSRLVEGLIDVPAAQEGRPNVFFFLGKGPEGKPRYCGNPAWASCPHRLACLKCRMYVGGDAAELLEAREGVLRFQTQVPMTPVEQAAADGDTARLRERLAELEGLPIPEPPGNAFVFHTTAPEPLPAPPPATDADRRTALTERLAGVQRDLATARELGKRSVLVKALERQVVALEADIAALPPAAPDATADAEAAI